MGGGWVRAATEPGHPFLATQGQTLLSSPGAQNLHWEVFQPLKFSVSESQLLSFPSLAPPPCSPFGQQTLLAVSSCSQQSDSPTPIQESPSPGAPPGSPPTATCMLGRVTQQALCPIPSRTGSRQDIDHTLRDARLQGQLCKLQGRERGDLRMRDRWSGPEGWAVGARH